MLFQEILFSLPFFLQLASCDQIRAASLCVWLLNQFSRAKKNRLSRAVFSASSVSGWLAVLTEAVNVFRVYARQRTDANHSGRTWRVRDLG